MGIWLVWNYFLFEGRHVQTFQVFSQTCALCQSFRMSTKFVGITHIVELMIDKSITWGFFDGSNQVLKFTNNIRGILYISDSQYQIQSKYGKRIKQLYQVDGIVCIIATGSD